MLGGAEEYVHEDRKRAGVEPVYRPEASQDAIRHALRTCHHKHCQTSEEVTQQILVQVVLS